MLSVGGNVNEDILVGDIFELVVVEFGKFAEITNVLFLDNVVESDNLSKKISNDDVVVDDISFVAKIDE